MYALVIQMKGLRLLAMSFVSSCPQGTPHQLEGIL